MWCVFHNAQWYWSDNLCKLATDQWRGSLGVRDSESCWFMEEIGTYMRCWESPGDLPRVIEIFVSFHSFRCAPLAQTYNFYHSWKIIRSFPRTYVRTYYCFFLMLIKDATENKGQAFWKTFVWGFCEILPFN